MDLFKNKDGTRKNPILLFGFLMSLLFIIIFFMLYAFMIEPLHRYVSFARSEFITTAIHCFIIAVIGTAICCVFFWLPDKRLVPYGFAFLGLITLLFYGTTFMLESLERMNMIKFMTLFFLTPVMIGNIVSWVVYFKRYKK